MGGNNLSGFNTIVVEDPVTNVIEVITPGPPGPPGPPVPIGSKEGDFLRWDSGEEKWEVAHEPLVLHVDGGNF